MLLPSSDSTLTPIFQMKSSLPNAVSSRQRLCRYCYMDAPHGRLEAGRKLHKNVESSIKQVLATTPHETPTIRTLAPHHENYTSSTNQTRGTLLEKRGRAHKRCTPVDPHIWMCRSGTTSTNLHTATM